MSILPLTCTSKDADCDAEEPRNSRCSSGCQRRYPRLVSNLFWLYLLAEGLCFVVDVAFLSTTVMAARNGALNMTAAGVASTSASYFFDKEEEVDDDVAFWNRTEETDNYASIHMYDTNNNQDDTPLVQDTTEATTTTEEIVITLDWPTLKDLVMQQWKQQWDQQQAMIADWFGSSTSSEAAAAS